MRVLPVAKRKSRRGPAPRHFLRKVCKKVKKTRDTANSAFSGTLQSWQRAASYKAYLKKTRFFEKNMFFFAKHVPPLPRGRRLLRVALMMPLSMRPVSGISQFAFYKLSHFFVLSRCSSLRRDPRTSFFALFSEAFSDARVYRFLRQTHSGAAFFATSKK